MKKKELIEAVIKKSGLDTSKIDVAKIIDATSRVIGEQVKKDGRIAITGLGIFTMRSRKARAGRNPKTGETIKIKASKNIGFKADTRLKAVAKI